MHLNKIEFKCKNCGWKASVPDQWTDLKPTYCGNKRCAYSALKASKTKKSFRVEPEMLEVKKPSKPKKETKPKTKSYTSSKKKKSSETKTDVEKKSTGYKRKTESSSSSDEASGKTD